MARKPEIWPPLLTPFLENGEVDFGAIQGLVDFYLARGVSGLLVTGLSAEPLSMNDVERAEIVAASVRAVAGRVPIAASVFRKEGEAWPEAIARLRAIGGVDCAVLLTGHLVEEGESDERFLQCLEAIIADSSGDLGLYEAPRPYKRLISDKALACAAESGRFTFLKDTCCDLARIKRRIDIVSGSRLKLMNAEVATFRASFEAGADGFCGLMANVFPDMLERAASEETDALSLLLTAGDMALEQSYPGSAKALLGENYGVGLTSFSRVLGRLTTRSDCTGLFALDEYFNRYQKTR
ncbi:dihydrodipicolinate synthase family protein [Martelella lutilitoris]|uniref:Dihydrodipicolinate synthase family protein n=1 Tax=Martelella lutilitoris TaxID=2583532 RepID=A0A5C4JUP1_9HYPH|nr:dihydrodipicolinate synthase family protein [Martelella lutilitoris]TNB49106.1 dihydrodipicolinate synthase family protein [Martelella lutilitoris]